jgi:hypothetical protein
MHITATLGMTSAINHACASDWVTAQSSSASRLTAGAFGFLTFTQCGDRPERYGEPGRFLTIPVQRSLQASRNTVCAVLLKVLIEEDHIYGSRLCFF